MRLGPVLVLALAQVAGCGVPAKRPFPQGGPHLQLDQNEPYACWALSQASGLQGARMQRQVDPLGTKF
jgi:hypothetical protein